MNQSFWFIHSFIVHSNYYTVHSVLYTVHCTLYNNLRTNEKYPVQYCTRSKAKDIILVEQGWIRWIRVLFVVDDRKRKNFWERQINANFNDWLLYTIGFAVVTRDLDISFLCWIHYGRVYWIQIRRRDISEISHKFEYHTILVQSPNLSYVESNIPRVGFLRHITIMIGHGSGHAQRKKIDWFVPVKLLTYKFGGENEKPKVRLEESCCLSRVGESPDAK